MERRQSRFDSSFIFNILVLHGTFDLYFTGRLFHRKRWPFLCLRKDCLYEEALLWVVRGLPCIYAYLIPAGLMLLILSELHGVTAYVI